MRTIGRKKEINKLRDSLISNKSELLAVYGRRRVGKTFLVREVYKEKMVLEVTGLHEGTMKDQLLNFHSQLAIRSKKAGKAKLPKDWFQAFELLRSYIDELKSKKKKVIFIDEFPWMDTMRSKFLMWFENFWNSYCTKRDDLVIVICGSAASYIVKNIINNKGGLHNRISQKIRLEPFNLHETDLFLKSKNIKFEHYDILQLYMVTGGVPYYLEKIKRGQSVVQNIDRLCFEKGGDLENEFNEVFTSLFANSGLHINIVKALSQSKLGLTRAKILSKCKLKRNGFTSSVIHELVESGFVSQYTPFGKKDRNSLFRLSDEFCAFYLRFMLPYENQGEGTWNKLSAKQVFKIWTGYAFETICLKHVQQIKNALGVAKVFSVNSSWFNDNAQVDLVIDRDDNRIDLCEIKFYNVPFEINKTYFENIRNKINEFRLDTKTRKGTYLTMVTTFGIKQNSHSLNIVENDITMSCFFADI